MTFKYNNVYLNDTSTVVGPHEKKGPFSSYYDRKFNDFYFNANSFEKAEINSSIMSIDILLGKIKKTRFDIDMHIGGDLLNQIVASNFAANSFKIPFMGIYSACATSVEGLIIASNMIEKKQINNAICTVSSHNMGAEKQFRYPTEYGAPKPKTTTFTTTGAAAAYLSSNKKGIKIEASKIGIVNDKGIKDVFNMGAVMAPAAADTIYKFLKDMNRDISYYDLVLTGDLGLYGKEILKEYMKTEYNIILEKYNDTASMVFDKNDKEVLAGGSGPLCTPLVTYTYIFDEMKKGNLKKVLLVATGSLHNPSVVLQKESIPSIAHLISLEAI